MNKFLIPAFTTTVTPQSLGLRPVQLVTEWGGLESQRSRLITALHNTAAGPVLLNCERHMDNSAATAELLKTASSYGAALVRPSTPTDTDLSVYVDGAGARPFEAAGMTPGGGTDRLTELHRVREVFEGAELWRCTHTTIDAWQVFDRDGHGICFAGLSPMETWRQMVLQRICLAEELHLPVRAVFGDVMLRNNRKITAEVRVPPADIDVQTKFLMRLGVEPIFMAGWSPLKYEKMAAAKAKSKTAAEPDGKTPYNAEAKAAVEAFAKA